MFGHDVNAEGLAETAALVAGAGGTFEIRVGDISQPAECQASVATCVETFGRLDVLGNNAGIARADHVTDVTEEQYRRMMGVNVDGYFFTAQAAIPHLLETDGNIVNVASNAGVMGQAYTVVYCMTKGAVVQLTRALAMEYAKTKIRVNAIGAERDPDHAVGELPHPGGCRRQPDAAVHGLSPDGIARRHRFDVRVRRLRRSAKRARRDPRGRPGRDRGLTGVQE